MPTLYPLHISFKCKNIACIYCQSFIDIDSNYTPVKCLFKLDFGWTSVSRSLIFFDKCMIYVDGKIFETLLFLLMTDFHKERNISLWQKYWNNDRHFSRLKEFCKFRLALNYFQKKKPIELRN